MNENDFDPTKPLPGTFAEAATNLGEATDALKKAIFDELGPFLSFILDKILRLIVWAKGE